MTTARPRVLFVGRTRYRLPLAPGLARKWDALSERMEVRVLASGTGDDPRFRLVRPRPVDGARFYAELPVRVARELRSFRPDAVIAESPYEAAAVQLARRVTRSRAKLVVDLHGDWHTSTRLYGSPLRRALAPAADRLADRAVRSADARRPVSEFAASLVRALGVEPTAVFAAYVDLDAFTGPVEHLPEEPEFLFVGVLERYKNVEVLAAAWRLAAARTPGARLRLVGDGTRVDVAEALERGGARWDRRLEPAEVARALDGSRALLLPSASEGLPRIAIEAFLRGRPVVGARAGGIPDIVTDGVSGLLVPPGDARALADAIERIATDAALAQRLAGGARAAAQPWTVTAEEYADRVRELVDRTVGGTP